MTKMRSTSSLLVVTLSIILLSSVLLTFSFAQGPEPQPYTSLTFEGLSRKSTAIEFSMDMLSRMYDDQPRSLWDISLQCTNIVLTSDTYIDVSLDEYTSGGESDKVTVRSKHKFVREDTIVMKDIGFPPILYPGRYHRRTLHAVVHGFTTTSTSFDSVECQLKIVSQTDGSSERSTLHHWSFDQFTADSLEVKLTPSVDPLGRQYEQFTYNMTNLNEDIGANMALMQLYDHSPVEVRVFKPINTNSPSYCYINEQRVTIDFGWKPKFVSFLSIPRGTIDKLGFGDWFIRCENIGLFKEEDINSNNNNSSLPSHEDVSKKINAMRNAHSLDKKLPRYFGVKVTYGGRIFDSDMWVDKL